MRMKMRRKIEVGLAMLAVALFVAACSLGAAQNAGAYWSGFNSPDGEGEDLGTGYVVVDALGGRDGIGPFRGVPSFEDGELDLSEDDEGTRRDVAAEMRDVVWKEVKVRAGDTLSRIAEEHGVSVKDITRANELTDQHKILAGQTLYIPTSDSHVLETMAYVRYLKLEDVKRKKQAKLFKLTDHVVKEGDTLWSIANTFDLDINSLFGCNKLGDANVLKVGAVIKIPNQDGILYQVKEGWTVARIADDFGIYAEAIVAANGLADGEEPAKGREIFLPGAKVSITQAAPSKAPDKADGRVADKGGKDSKGKGRDKAKTPRAGGSKSGSARFRWPIGGKISSTFGWRKDPVRRGKDFHTGLDIRAPRGTVIVASREGKVVHSGWMGGYGKTIVIQHPDGLTTLYGHCSKLIAANGARVKAGQRIALVGSTGRSTGNHVHFEVRRNGSPMNPLKYLR